MRLANISLVILGSILIANDAFAGAWTVPKYHVWGEYYMKWDYAKEAFNVEGRKKKLSGAQNARSWEYVMEPKLEFGVTDWLTAMGSIEYKEGHYKELSRPANWGTFVHKNNGITNIKFGGRWRLIKDPVVVSIQPKFFMYPGYGNDHGDDPEFRHQPGIGKGDDAFELRVLIGKTYDIPLPILKWLDGKLPIYGGIETGYRWRNNHVAHDIPYFVEGGFWPFKWLLVKSELDGYKSNPGTGSIKESYGIWRIGCVWQVFGDSILREGDKMFNIEFQYGMSLWGKNTNAFQEWVLKVQSQF